MEKSCRKNRKDEVPPPWVEHPGFPPYDTFWRQSGEPWLAYVWLPFWEGLDESKKEDYISRWEIPEVWRLYCPHINLEFAEWLESIDDE